MVDLVRMLWQEPNNREMLRWCTLLLLGSLFVGFSLWLVFAQLMPIALIFFNVSTTLENSWVTYIPIIIGNIAGGIFVKYGTHRPLDSSSFA